MQTSSTGIFKWLLYARVGLHVLWHFRSRLSPGFLRRAVLLLLAFRYDKPVRNGRTWKLHLYLPAYPTPAFFKSVEDKLLCDPPRPVTVVFSTTKACTFNCPHCYQRLDRGADVPEAVLHQTVDALSVAGVAFLNVEGGDAFLDFGRLLRLVDHADRTMEIWVNTTGANVTRERLAALKAHGVYGLMVSMHGATPAAHDAFTAHPGAFELARRTLLWCDELGLGSAINAVLTADEMTTLPALMDLARELHCGFVQLIHPKRAGKWLGHDVLDAQESALVAAVARAHRRYNGWRFGAYPALAAQAMEESPRMFGCTAGGIDRFYVGASGEVQPCEFLNLSFGNVRDEPFDAIFARMRAAFPVPSTDWLCHSLAGPIADYLREHKITTTPLPPEATREILAKMRRSGPTKLYRRMGLYAS